MKYVFMHKKCGYFLEVSKVPFQFLFIQHAILYIVQDYGYEIKKRYMGTDNSTINSL